jgi:hypothetical protein
MNPEDEAEIRAIIALHREIEDKKKEISKRRGAGFGLLRSPCLGVATEFCSNSVQGRRHAIKGSSMLFKVIAYTFS